MTLSETHDRLLAGPVSIIEWTDGSSPLRRPEPMIVRDVMTDEHAEALPDGRRLEELPKRPVQTGASYHAMFVDVRPRKLEQGLCQSCVRYTLKPGSNSVIYGNIPMHIVVARSR